jgi:uncharacterized protein
MKIVIFGATGMVGKQLVQQALFNGHEVRAFGRNVFTAGLPEDGKLELVQGALFDEGEVYNAIKGTDGVLSALGGGFDGVDKTRSLGMKNIIKQMNKAGVKRIVSIGGMGVLDGADGKLLLEGEDYPKQYIPVGQEHLKAYEQLAETGLDWTFVCPPDITDAAPTGTFYTAADTVPEPNNYKINSGDLALFMLKELEKREYVGKRVGISN